MHSHKVHRNKPRLELALYARPKHPDSFHWALFVASKSTKGKPTLAVTKRHVKNTLQNIDGELTQPWRYENVDIPDCTLEPRLLVRVIIGKVLVSNAAVEQIFQQVPIYQVDDLDQDRAAAFRCQSWARAAVESLSGQNAVALQGDWDGMVGLAVKYVEEKKSQGRWSEGFTDSAGVPMLDLFNDTGTIS